MRVTRAVLAVGVALGVALLSGRAGADVWDQDTSAEDDGPGTDNELVHGARQVHDLAAQGGVADQDWYRIAAQPYSSYEVIVEGIPGDVFTSGLRVDILAADGTTVLAFGAAREPNGLGAVRSVRWDNGAIDPTTVLVRVDGASACGVSCTTADQYTIRFYDTTPSIARFNNTGTTRTSLLLHNTSGVFGSSVLVTYWDMNGNHINSGVFDLRARSQVLIDTANLGANGRVGWMSLSHRLPFGAIQGKAIEANSATGASVHTPLVYLPY